MHSTQQGPCHHVLITIAQGLVGGQRTLPPSQMQCSARKSNETANVPANTHGRMLLRTLCRVQQYGAGHALCTLSIRSLQLSRQPSCRANIASCGWQRPCIAQRQTRWNILQYYHACFGHCFLGAQDCHSGLFQWPKFHSQEMAKIRSAPMLQQPLHVIMPTAPLIDANGPDKQIPGLQARCCCNALKHSLEV